MNVVGVDSCRSGWYFVHISPVGFGSGVCSSVGDLFDRFADSNWILIDIPIGLRDEGDLERLCDKEARQVLGVRSSSVFPVPARPTLSSPNYSSASELNRSLTGRGLSKQSWAIAPKIREVDDFLRRTPEARDTIREVHPEVCFWSLAGNEPMSHKKRSKEGAAERYEVLKSVYPEMDELVVEGASDLPKVVRRDDFLDAASAAITGVLGGSNLRTLPPDPERDAYGLPMEMVYAPRP